MTKIFKINDPSLEINSILLEKSRTKIDIRKIESRYSKPDKEKIVFHLKKEFLYPPFCEEILNNKYFIHFNKSVNSSFRLLLDFISANGKNKNIADFKISFINEVNKKRVEDLRKNSLGLPLKPLLKWVGSKAQLKERIKEEIQKIIPDSDDFVYHEPFLGGGSLAFDITKECAFLSDYNEELINFYEIVRDNPAELINLSEKVEEIYNEFLEDEEKRIFYNNYREKFNYPIIWSNDNENCLSVKSSSDKILKACQFLFLNKCDFNGLYRVNSKGIFNVPWGQKDRISLINEETKYDEEKDSLDYKNKYKNFWKLSTYLNNRNVILKQMDFKGALSINPSDKQQHLFYLDPPYLAEEGKETTFTDYTKEGFGLKDLEKIKELSDKLIEKGNYVIISNHDNAKIRELFNEENYTIKDDLSVYRSISGIKENRKSINELLIIGKKVNKREG